MTLPLSGQSDQSEFHGPDEDPCIHCLGDEVDRLRYALKQIAKLSIKDGPAASLLTRVEYLAAAALTGEQKP